MNEENRPRSRPSRAPTHRLSVATVLVRVTAPFLVVCAIAFSVTLVRQGGDARREFAARAEEAARLYAKVLARPLADRDEGAIRTATHWLRQDPELLTLSVRDVSGREVFQHRAPRPAPPRGVLERIVDQTASHQVEVLHADATVGQVEATFHKPGAAHQWRFKPANLLWMEGLAIAMVMAIAVWIARRFGRRYGGIVERVRTTAVTVDDATGALRQVSTSQTSAAADSAAAVSQTRAVASEVGVAAGAAGERARTLDGIARRTEAQSEEAVRAVEQAGQAMQAVHEQAGAIGAALSDYAEKTAAVGVIAKTVAGLAERSNLLALNAALEASRAGEKGRAFSVVAHEMRALAGATTRAAVETQTLVSDVRAAVERWTGPDASGELRVAAAEESTAVAVEAIRGFDAATRQLAELGRELGSAGEAQRVAISQTVEALDEGAKAAAEELEGVREVEASATELAELSRSLVGVLDGSVTAAVDPHLTEAARRAARARTGGGSLLRQVAPVTGPLLVLTVALLGFAIPSLPDVEELARRATSARMVSLSNAVVAAAATGNGPQLQALLVQAQEEYDAGYLVLRDASGRPFAATGAVPPTLVDAGDGALRGPLFELTRPLPGGQARISAGFDAGHAHALYRRVMMSTALIALVVLLGGTLIAWWVARMYARVFERLLAAVEAAARTLDGQISRLAATSAQQAAAASQAAAALSETGAGADELGRGAAAATSRANALIDAGGRCGADADRVTSAMADASAAIFSLRQYLSSLTSALGGFNERAEAIGDVASTVAQLAERIELLAVNASIEAARAGEGSGGFGVVAEQMRALADGSAGAAEKVKGLVADVRGALARALENAREGERRVRSAEELAANATRRVATFAEVAREAVRVGGALGHEAARQRSAIDQMVEAIVQASESTAVSAKGTASVRAVADQLAALTRGLVDTSLRRDATSGVVPPPDDAIALRPAA